MSLLDIEVLATAIELEPQYAHHLSEVIRRIPGIDLGINFLATSYDSKGKTTFFNVFPKEVSYPQGM
ncbi:hypothetical protein [Metalysinibacillus jejuensis]|uniref:hypothetical protein n=1 Tax=Metalysinibacillus jejuensis TaxID=914327 RepID=UPI001290617D|nr:hypothetical protein [Metalysinibacillus jejuensis]